VNHLVLPKSRRGLLPFVTRSVPLQKDHPWCPNHADASKKCSTPRHSQRRDPAAGALSNNTRSPSKPQPARPPGDIANLAWCPGENWHGLCNSPSNSGFGGPGTGRPGNPRSYDRQADLQPPRLQKSRMQDSVAHGRPGFRGPWYRQAGESPLLFTGVLASSRRAPRGAHAEPRHPPRRATTLQGALVQAGRGIPSFIHRRAGSQPPGSARAQCRTASSVTADDHPSGGLGTGRPGNPLSYSARRLTSSRQRPSAAAPCHSPCRGRVATNLTITP